ncbi:MAG: RdgB/HAM1 family non-canonical purine NTP pyrophosphatase [Gammaproteobacteria bacterium]|nr:RdgB/HAM1 family non-canonical purine NTP pyrophosphatase [Gammaproteobacteria bacterium]NIR83950.1 RdgB/HAM1 family non-canonical purine NTP pyrophosphatase [Gammaproteobacteria bacterium]NIR88993.1 RdgB/HAM1 family non-canonical purine NTP pyrophosphatase [Gammaproteobacteria bacterium]NIV74546.1 RdgB/HAM1 family non-canonical purine NTP pyrophosphatase [Gammaproteobacteria bacterium]
MRTLLAALGVGVVPQSAYNVPAVEETALTFVENALLKARRACEVSGLPAIGDDSGLVVDALAGAPGIRSARYAGPRAGDADNIRKLLGELSGVADRDRAARFYCAMVYLRHARDPAPVVCDGSWEGRILEAPRGGGGFGYDPVFYVPTHECTAAELDPATKNALSHRGQALRALFARLDV